MEKKKSFNKYQKTCRSHIQLKEKRCICESTGKTCNKMNCPEYGGKERFTENDEKKLSWRRGRRY